MLLDRNGVKPDIWSRAETPPPGAAGLLTWDVFLENRHTNPAGPGLGIELPNDFHAEEVKPHFGDVSLIAVCFPSFADGRGFTLARRLRRFGFTGTLRAVGPLIPDQFAYTLACGFDEVELPEASAARQTPRQWTAALASRSQAYQRGYPGQERSILDRRRAKASGHV